MDIHLRGIIDSTLREGEQAPGITFSRVQKLTIVRYLQEVGIEEIELGVANRRSPELLSLVRDASQNVAGRKCNISLWCRCSKEDIRFARLCKPDVLSLSMPVSDILLQEKLHQSRDIALQRLARSLAEALDAGFAFVSVGLEDATRADDDFLLRVVELVSEAGASRLRLADTVGIASPGRVDELIRKVKGNTHLPIVFHAHNDFGMATANSVAALEAGARWVDATILGLGERAGNCRLEEIVGYLSLCRNLKRYRPAILNNLCQLVAEAANMSISAYHPVIGKNIFTSESGLHVHGLTNDPRTYEPYDPRLLGRTRAFLFGSKTGRGAVRNSLASFGYQLGEKEIEDLVDHIRQQALEKRYSLDVNGLVRLARAKGMIRE